MAANGVDTSVEPTADLYATFIYLDSSERKRFSQSSHEYLVTCVQHTGAETISPGASAKTTNIRLNFNHPVKNLAWVLKGSNFGQFTVGPRGTDNDRWAALASAKLQLNGHDRFDERKGSYFSQAQPWEHMKTKPVAGVYSYSFALRPSEVRLVFHVLHALARVSHRILEISLITPLTPYTLYPTGRPAIRVMQLLAYRQRDPVPDHQGGIRRHHRRCPCQRSLRGYCGCEHRGQPHQLLDFRRELQCSPCALRYVAFSTCSALSLMSHASYWKSHSSPRSHLRNLQAWEGTLFVSFVVILVIRCTETNTTSLEFPFVSPRRLAYSS